MTFDKGRSLALIAVSYGLLFDLCPAVAQTPEPSSTYPTRPLRLVVGLPAGGSTDIVARIVAAGLGDTLGQHVVVDNRPGRSGILAGERVAKHALADGYTLLFGASFYSEVLASVEGSLPYDPIKDFTAIALVTKIPNVLVVHAALPVKNVDELIAYAKRSPRPLHYASSGNGSSAHLAMEIFKRRVRVDAVHVPYKGAPQALLDLFSGQISLMFGNIPAQMPHVRSGKTRALAVSAAERSFQLPEVPTLSEAGVPGFEMTVWYGAVAPARIPYPLVRRLNAALTGTLTTPGVVTRMMEQGAKPAPGTAEAFAEFHRAERVKWTQLVRDTGIRSD